MKRVDLHVRHAAGMLLSACLAAALPGMVRAHQGAHDEHHALHAQSNPDMAVARSTVSVKLPPVRVRQHSGKTVSFDTMLDDSKPVLLNFVYTSCTAICLPMAQVFAEVQERLGSDADRLQMLSVSIDPGQDTPAHLKEYAERFHAGRQWLFNTGSQKAIDDIERAFNVYRPDKMGHTPVTFVRPRGSRQWLRLDGFASPQQLIREALPPVTAAR